jgi:hypothetical protein
VERLSLDFSVSLREEKEGMRIERQSGGGAEEVLIFLKYLNYLENYISKFQF